MRTALQQSKRIVVKIGTSTLTYETGRLNLQRIEQLVRQIADLINRGKEVILVSSGAVGAGLPVLGLTEKPKDISTKQAAAAVGQGILLHMYEKLFREYGITVGQILLTREDSVMKKRYVNLRNALLSLISLQVVPVINENDVVAVDELKIGDNDTLSAVVASIVEADLLIVLSDIDGLYTANPNTHSEAKLIPQIDEITPAITALAGEAGSSLGTGGMVTKLEAATIAVTSGVHMVIANGSRPNVLTELIDGESIGTHFVPKEDKPHMKKRWLAFGSRLQGSVSVDDGCANALLKHGSSLLAVGITDVQGSFNEGETVSVFHNKVEIGRGIVNFSSLEIEKIKGLKTDAIVGVLGVSSSFDEVIHRDNLVILR